ncbi:non-hydrolyzing UDP-N-acetylglucosamine 2-epimerase [Candidatus Chloroploca asiatica]|uniref:UDP-N-acetylglucosamine 2-epimerase n=1 Tax=Candidatus Chloroploca asiatica TaxID=1506545 RepID=A0A2H3KR34_9CHLR|nr:UDP-N-acetylglucosamine 2-epimerase (non-hydrolyzing) [Candidatus Chloroploca asiatica]PDV99972.1 UDP-N-acetylglucosamine 2-epimerase [Candidatus Chloroploca asiatica]
MKLIHVVGARPNFMKVAPVLHALGHYDAVRQIIVHTGQHYDVNMSDIFFQQLGIPAPDVNLEIGSASHAQQTAQIMARFEPVVLEQKPDMVLVYGDVNSTVAATLVCAKLLIPVAHVEAGLRSGDRTMPEEINRLVTDQLADLLFTPSVDGDQNLLREGIAAEKIHCVGNVMIDTLVRLQPQAEALWPALQTRFELHSSYGLITLHRPSNVDEPSMLGTILATLNDVAKDLPLLFPIHPRTRQRIHHHGLDKLAQRIQFCDPLGYLDFLALQAHASVVLTDSGGVQEETTYLQVPCITLRENTERPVTVDVGSNILVGRDMERLLEEVARILQGEAKLGAIPPLWDGRTGERIASILHAL